MAWARQDPSTQRCRGLLAMMGCKSCGPTVKEADGGTLTKAEVETLMGVQLKPLRQRLQAIVLDKKKMEQVRREQELEEKEAKEEKEKDDAKQARLRKFWCGMYNEMSLYVLGRQNRLRLACVCFAKWPWFDRVIIVAIVISSVFLAMENPSMSQSQIDLFEIFDKIFLVLFTIEFFVKVEGAICHSLCYHDSYVVITQYVVISLICCYNPICCYMTHMSL